MTKPVSIDRARTEKVIRAAAKAIRPRLLAMNPGEDSTLGHLRRSLGKTQAEVATAMGTEQDRVSRLERRHDMRVSSLREYVSAMGGTLRLVVDLPEGESVTLHLPERKRPDRESLERLKRQAKASGPMRMKDQG